MAIQKKDNKSISEFELLNSNGLLEVEPVTNHFDLSDTTRFMKVDSADGLQIYALASQAPNIAATIGLSQMYTVKFPENVCGKLTVLKQGGFGSMLRGQDGKFVGSASFIPVSPVATAALGVFTVMSIATQQYFLTKINNELRLISQKVDKVLDFLYGDKKAELVSEISFVQRIIRDFSSVMRHDHQQIATIIGIQEAEKVAMKDIEFYIRDLESAANEEFKNGTDLVNVVNKVVQIYETLSASLQLYVMSIILEAYLSQNTDMSFLEGIKNDATLYTSNCFTRMLGSISILKGRVDTFKVKGKIDKAQILDNLSNMTDSLNGAKALEIQGSIAEAITEMTREKTFVVTEKGDVYYQLNAS